MCRRDRGREGWLPSPPSLRTVRAVLPHTALRLVVLPTIGLTGQAMGRRQGKQPTLGKEGVRPFASSHPFLKGRQHALRPHRRFHRGPTAPDLSGLLSLPRHFSRAVFPLHGPHTSTFLRPFAPRALPRFFTAMDALTPVRSALRPDSIGNELRPFYRTGLPA